MLATSWPRVEVDLALFSPAFPLILKLPCHRRLLLEKSLVRISPSLSIC